MRSPFAGGLGPGGPRTLYVLGLIAAIKAVSLVGIAEALARGIAALFDGATDVSSAVQLGAAAVILRAVATWAGPWFATRASIGAKEELRTRLADRMLERPGVDVGAATTLATRGLDDLDPYYRTVLPAAMGAAVIPLVVGLRILSADWLSALIVVLTVPLIPVFMILIGQHTRDRVDEASGALDRLADHLVELARGLPVLVGLGRVEEQADALRAISDDHRRRTLGTLRTAFLSALALELIATISVALVAVTIGIRLVGGDLPLEVGLLVLVLAPECYAPLREVGTAFHASQDGVAALRRAREVLDAPAAPGRDAPTGDVVVEVDGLEIGFAGRRDAIAVPRVQVRSGETVALVGPSGAGKSTVLRALAGRLDAGESAGAAPASYGTDVTDGAGGHDATLRGIIRVADPVAWLPQHPQTIGDTVLDELRRWAGPGAEARTGELLDRLGLSRLAHAVPAALSPGELRRLAVARTLLRVDAGARVALLDEPTAHLDDTAAGAVVALIAELRGRAALILVSHDDRVLTLADRRLPVGASLAFSSDRDVSAGRNGRLVTAETQESLLSAGGGDGGQSGTTGPGEESTDSQDIEEDGTGATIRTVGAMLRPVAGRLVGSVLLGSVAALSAAALTAVSGWLIVRAAEQPPIMYLLVAIVGVRFFGLARSILRYAERLVTHDAVFAAAGDLRGRLWRAVAARGTASPALRTGGAALDALVTTADRIRDALPRVVVPPLVGVVTAGAALLAVSLLHAPAVLPLAVALVLALGIAPAVALAADRRAGALEGELRSRTTRRLAALLQAADDLRANGVDGAARAEIAELDRRAGVLARRAAGATGIAGALVVIALAGCAVAMLALSAPAVAAGQLSVEVVAVLALMPLALIDPAVAVVDAVQQAPGLLASVRRIQPVLDVPATASGSVPLDRVDGFALESLSAGWPGTDAPAFAEVSAEVGRSEWLAVTGPSGSGKSTLLSVLLGYLPAASGSYRLDGDGREVDAGRVDPSALRRRIAWCPQDAHVFASTIRGNLLLSRPRDGRPSDEEMRAALAAVGLNEVVSGSTHGLDTAVGTAGSALSGGERQRLAVARALLADADVVLLDEPTAHLDADTADDMMLELRAALADRTTVLVTHREDDLIPSDLRLRLGTRRTPALAG